MRKFFIIALLCIGSLTKASAQSLTIVNNTSIAQSVILGASAGSCTTTCCPGMSSGIVQMSPGSTRTYANINDLCTKGNPWLGFPCPSSFAVTGSHWDLAKVIVPCGVAQVGSGCDPMVKATATLCIGGSVKWTSTGGNVTVTIN